MTIDLKEKCVYIIEELWTDSLENHLSAAIGYDIIGFCENCNEAEVIVEKGGFIEGTGYPINKGRKVARYKFTKINQIK